MIWSVIRGNEVGYMKLRVEEWEFGWQWGCGMYVCRVE